MKVLAKNYSTQIKSIIAPNEALFKSIQNTLSATTKGVFESEASIYEKWKHSSAAKLADEDDDKNLNHARNVRSD